MNDARLPRWNRCQRAAVWLAALPLAFGLAVQTTWWFTQWDDLMTVGIVTVVVGAAMGLVGERAASACPRCRKTWRRRRHGAWGFTRRCDPCRLVSHGD